VPRRAPTSGGVQKLGRTYGCANIQVAHKVSDVAAQTDDGTAESKIAAGLLADAATKIVLRQAPDQVRADPGQIPPAQRAFGLSDRETAWAGQLAPGRALWLIGDHRALVQHHLAATERHLVDTDQRMREQSLPTAARPTVEVEAPAEAASAQGPSDHGREHGWVRPPANPEPHPPPSHHHRPGAPTGGQRRVPPAASMRVA
jgi:hypothetical protein